MRVILYSRPGCHLCDESWADLVEYQKQIGFELVKRSIEDDPADLERFQHLIPVVDIEGGPLLYPPHDWAVLGRALRTAAAHTA